MKVADRIFALLTAALVAAGCSGQGEKPEKAGDVHGPGHAREMSAPMAMSPRAMIPAVMTVDATPSAMNPMTLPAPKPAMQKPRVPTADGYPVPTAPANHPLARQRPPKGFLVSSTRTRPEAGVLKDFVTVKSAVYNKRLPLRIILPASYERFPRRHYPFIILLGGNHFIKKGAFSSIRYWEGLFNIARRYSNMLTGNLRAEIVKSFSGDDRKQWLALVSRRLPAETIIILTHTDYFSEFDRFRRYLLREALPWLFSAYRLHRDPALSAIDGISLGGSEGLLIALERPGIFHAMGGVQPSVTSLGPRMLKAFTAQRDYLRTHHIPVNITTGAWDITRTAVTDFAGSLKALGLNLTFVNYPGGHDYYYYQGVATTYLILRYGEIFREVLARRYLGHPERFGTNRLPLKSPATPAFVRPPASWHGDGHRGILTAEYLSAIPVYRTVHAQKNVPEVSFADPLRPVPPGTAVKIVKMVRGGYKDNVRAVRVSLPDGTAGWVSVNHLALPARVRKSEPRSSSIRVFSTACPLSEVVERLPARAPLYVMARDLVNLWKFLECDQQLLRVFTPSGHFGYAECTFLTPYKTTFTK